MEHPLCRHTVTLYRAQGRQVVEGCFCTWKDLPKASILGDGSRREFFLVLPGRFGPLAPGDWVCQGVGPEGAQPADVPGAEKVTWARPMHDPGIFGPAGRLLHTEAGNG